MRNRSANDGETHAPSKTDDFRFREDPRTAVFTCKCIWEDDKPILMVAHDADGDWQFLCGADHSESAADGMLVCLANVVVRDPSLNELASMCTSHVATRAEPRATWTIVDETLENVRRVIDEHGLWVGVIEADGDGPAFAYTIGLHEKHNHPEIIVFGLPPDSMHRVLNRCGDMIRDGKRFEVGASISGVLHGYEVRFRKVTADSSFSEYLGCACRHYGDQHFPVLQLVWPDKARKFPGDEGAADFLAERQPLLT